MGDYSCLCFGFCVVEFVFVFGLYLLVGLMVGNCMLHCFSLCCLRSTCWLIVLTFSFWSVYVGCFVCYFEVSFDVLTYFGWLVVKLIVYWFERRLFVVVGYCCLLLGFALLRLWLD